MKKLVVILAAALALSGCPYEETYKEGPFYVFYDGSGYTSGAVPVDSKAYNQGQAAIVQGPGDMAKEGYRFEGWQRNNGYGSIYQPGEPALFDYDHIVFSAYWRVTGNRFLCTESGGELTITGYRTDPEDSLLPLNVPASIDGTPVTRIGREAFKGLSFRGVTLPEGLKEIGDYSFYNCGLSEGDITLPGTLETIGAYAFDKNSFQTIEIPASVQTIRTGAFYNSRVTTIKIGAGVTIDGLSALGFYGDSFKAYYDGQSKAADVYLYSGGVWTN